MCELRTVLESLPDIVVRYDRTMRRTFVSRSYETRTGTPVREVLGRTVDEVCLSPTIGDNLKAGLRRVLDGGQREVVELGDTVAGRWIQVEMVPEHDPAGTVTGVVAIGRDVTQLRAHEDALRESERRYRTLVEHIPAITYVAGLDAETPAAYVSPQIERFLGYSPAVWRADPSGWVRSLHPDDRSRVLADIQGAMDRRTSYAVEYRLIARDGATRWFHDEGTPLRDVAGPITGYQGVAFDITARVEAERELACRESRFRSLIEHAQDLVAIIAPDGVVRYASPSHETLLGYPPAELIGVDAFDLVHADDREELRQVLTRGLSGGVLTVPLQSYRFRHRDGSWRVIESSATNALDDPSVNGIVVNSRDITERSDLEAELRQSQKMEAVGRLAGGIAHDFNNILTVIGANAEFLIDALPEQDPRRDDAREIRESARRAANLTRQLLAFSRRQVLEPKPLELPVVVQDLAKMLRRLIGEDVELQLDLDARTPSIVADPGQLEQVILNLAVNARDAMPEGGCLTIRTAVRDVRAGDPTPPGAPPTGRWAVLDVTDTGVGMAPGVVEQIFEPFFTTKEHGTGLGLATVYGIVRQSHGQITVDSAPGAGSTFRILLPEQDAAIIPEAPDAKPADRPAAGSVVLVVEDDAGVRSQARRILSAHGYRVLDAASGADALQVAEAENGEIDLLLTDVVMPRMNGRQLAERLRARRPRIRVLYTSGYTDEVVDRHGVLAPGVSFLPKPYGGETLRRKVAAVLGSARP